MLIPSPKKGFLWDTKEKVFVPDPDYNKEKARKIRFGATLMLEDEVKELLGFGKNFMPMTELNVEYLLGDITTTTTTKNSRLRLEETLIKLKDDLQSGVLPQMSYLISLGDYGKVNELSYYLLAKAYIAGLKVSSVKYIFELDDFKIRENLIEDDIVVIITKSVLTQAELSNLSSILQNREVQDKPTIVINNKKDTSFYRILLNTTNENRLDLLTKLELDYLNLSSVLNDDLEKLITDDSKKVDRSYEKHLSNRYFGIRGKAGVEVIDKVEAKKSLEEEIRENFYKIIYNISSERCERLIREDIKKRSN